jgi:hypothetical protein
MNGSLRRNSACVGTTVWERVPAKVAGGVKSKTSRSRAGPGCGAERMIGR